MILIEKKMTEFDGQKTWYASVSGVAQILDFELFHQQIFSSRFVLDFAPGNLMSILLVFRWFLLLTV